MHPFAPEGTPIPEITPQEHTHEITKTPPEVIDGALRRISDEEDAQNAEDSPEEKKPTLH